MSDNGSTASPDEFQRLWGELPPVPRVTSAQVRERAARLAAGLRRRAIIGAVLMLLGIGNPVVSTLLRSRPVATWEWALVIYLVAFLCAMLWMTSGSWRKADPALDSAESIHNYRTMLRKERDRHQGYRVGVRLSIPLFGLIVYAVVNAVNGAPPASVPFVAVLVGVVMYFLWRHSLQRARLLQDHIELLDNSLSS